MTVAVKVRRSTIYTIAENDREFEVDHEPVDHVDPIVRELPDGRVVVGYLSHDDDPMHPLDDCDGCGKIYDRRHMSQSERNEMHQLLGWDEYGECISGRTRNPYSVPLDVYSHGQDSWSLAGEGMNDRWDTSRNAGIWLPDDCCLEHIEYSAIAKLLPKGTSVSYESTGSKVNVITYTLPDGTKRGGYKTFVTAIHAAAKKLGVKLSKEAIEKAAYEEAVVCAKQAVEEYNKYINGDAYGVCVEVFAKNEEEYEHDGENDACWGFLGSEYAKEELISNVEYRFNRESE